MFHSRISGIEENTWTKLLYVNLCDHEFHESSYWCAQAAITLQGVPSDFLSETHRVQYPFILEELLDSLSKWIKSKLSILVFEILKDQGAPLLLSKILYIIFRNVSNLFLGKIFVVWIMVF